MDSRKIVSDQPLLALRVGHVLFAGEEMARQVCFSFFSLFLEFVLCVLVFVVLISLPPCHIFIGWIIIVMMSLLFLMF